MKEQAFRFGRAHHMVGVAGVPAASAHAVGVVVLNAGLVHRIGPFRLHVELTRRLNACGYPTLRFDLSTVGDSGASGEPQTREQQVRADVADAMSLLSRQSGCTRVVLIGLCSGAQNAHAVACTDASVAGAIFLDGYAYRTIACGTIFRACSMRDAGCARSRPVAIHRHRAAPNRSFRWPPCRGMSCAPTSPACSIVA